MPELKISRIVQNPISNFLSSNRCHQHICRRVNWHFLRFQCRWFARFPWCSAKWISLALTSNRSGFTSYPCRFHPFCCYVSRLFIYWLKNFVSIIVVLRKGLFMILMPILLMNLLIGLAVGDIESVRRNAQLKRLAMQVVLHTELERKLPQMWLEKADKSELIEYPNSQKCKLGMFDFVLRKWFCNPFNDESNFNSCSSKELNYESINELQTVAFR